MSGEPNRIKDGAGNSWVVVDHDDSIPDNVQVRYQREDDAAGEGTGPILPGSDIVGVDQPGSTEDL